MNGPEERLRAYRREWARLLIERGRTLGEVPQYGSAQWCALAEDDPRRIAAVIGAAEAWAFEGDHMGELLAAEIDAWRAAPRAAQAAQDRATADYVRRNAGAWIDAKNRKADQETNPPGQPRQGDYTGGAVTWEPEDDEGHQAA